jgi:hypothetical protein
MPIRIRILPQTLIHFVKILLSVVIILIFGKLVVYIGIPKQHTQYKKCLHNIGRCIITVSTVLKGGVPEYTNMGGEGVPTAMLIYVDYYSILNDSVPPGPFSSLVGGKNAN